MDEVSVRIGVDIGGTKCALSCGACTAGAIEILHREEFETRGLPWRQVLAEYARRIARLPAFREGRPASVGVSCGGPLDSRRGVVLAPPEM